MDREKIQEAKMDSLKSAWDAAKKNTDYSFHLQKLHKYQLLQIAEDSYLGVHNVRIVASGAGGKSCPACKKSDNKILNIEAELNRQSLPNRDCSCTAYHEHQKGFCLCYYEILFDDEL
ncbi:hypothetical protein MNBD_GAMMA12-1778 [hydrothermal vent metagenome]|uniref:Uncharacterized protein n=1 Tax=hydrothermal vent metagenome TaxID=652676 RepID=A0A3B0XU88_9ZZZZ